MPGLVAFRRRWAIGSDDLFFPAIGAILVRVGWVIVVGTVYGIHNNFDCKSGMLLQIYYIGMMAAIGLNVILDCVIVYVSSQGSIHDDRPRRKMPVLLYVKLVFVLPELGWNVLGTYVAFGVTSDCEKFLLYAAMGTVIGGWFFCILVIVGLALVFDPLGARSNKIERTSGIHTQAAIKVWETRCRMLCCCCVGNDNTSQNAFTDVAELLSEFFGDVDVVPTDIAAAMILLQKYQENMGHHKIPALPSAVSQPEPTETWLTLPYLHHYMKFAMGSYGWPLFVFAHPDNCLCKLWGHLRCCACCRSAPTEHAHVDVHSDNCCECNLAAIKATTGIKDGDLLYVSFENKIYEVPFYVAIDHQHQAVVVAIRGTLSLKDALTDMTAECEEMTVEALPGQQYLAHKGILNAAKYIQRKLENVGILEKITTDYPGYQLVITGHSLGAGTAAILAILLKPRFDDLRCYAYSPPGGLISPILSEHCQSYVCSVVLGKDLVPRLGLTTIDRLKRDLMNAVGKNRAPKYKILAGGCMSLLCGLDNMVSQGDDDSPVSDEPLVDHMSVQHKSYTESSQLLEGAVNSLEAPLLHPPGRILQIYTTTNKRSYQYHWSKAADYQLILVSPQMFKDHLPDVVFGALSSILAHQTVHGTSYGEDNK